MTKPRKSDDYIKQIELGDGKTASLRFANLDNFKAIICRINWPYREGIVIPFDSLSEGTECSHENCTCEKTSILESTINTLKLCANCLKSIHKKIKEILDIEPEHPVARNI